MKKITMLQSKAYTILLSMLIILTITSNSFAQIYGNKDIVTQTFSLDQIQTLEINLGATIIIDMDAKSEISITTDSNLIPYIDRSVNNGKMDLNQKKWIETSNQFLITIGAPALTKLISDAHCKLTLKNMSADQFELYSNVGKLSLQGSVNQLTINNEHAKIDASQLYAQDATIKITSWGRVTARVENQLTSKVSDNGFLKLVNQPKERLGEQAKSLSENEEDKRIFEAAKYIDFKIKNKSLTRRHFVVVGPKQSGSYFSYGFPLWPGQVKDERWTVGTKIYKENRLGLRKLVVTIEADDAGTIVDLD